MCVCVTLLGHVLQYASEGELRLESTGLDAPKKKKNTQNDNVNTHRLHAVMNINAVQKQ